MTVIIVSYLQLQKVTFPIHLFLPLLLLLHSRCGSPGVWILDSLAALHHRDVQRHKQPSPLTHLHLQSESLSRLCEGYWTTWWEPTHTEGPPVGIEPAACPCCGTTEPPADLRRGNTK